MKTATYMPETITDDLIRVLRHEACRAGDMTQARLCNRALAGDERTRQACLEVIRGVASEEGTGRRPCICSPNRSVGRSGVSPSGMLL